MMDAKEYFLQQVADLVSLVRIYRHDDDRKDALMELKATVNSWLMENDSPLHVMGIRYNEDSQAAVLECKLFCDQDDIDEYLNALQAMLAPYIEAEEWDPKLYGHEFQLVGVDEEPWGKGARVISLPGMRVLVSMPAGCTALYDERTGLWSMEATLPLDATTPPTSALSSYGPQKKGRKGKAARW